MLRVAYLVKTLKAYRVPLFSNMQKIEGVTSLFIFDSEPEQDEKVLLQGSPLNYQVLETIKLSWVPFVQNRFRRSLPTNIFSVLSRFKPAVVFCPEYSVETLLAIMYGKLSGCKLIVWSSLTTLDERITFPGQSYLRSMVRKYADAYVCYSNLAIDYLRMYNVPEEKCFLVENCTDVQYFLSHYRSKKRHEEGAPVRLLYVGAVVYEKGLWDLFQALSDLLHLSWTLNVVGDGNLRESLETFAKERLENRVFFIGQRLRHELPDLYNNADVVVLPSHSDVWGHVIDEAMASGCCVLASDKSIAAVSLIENGVNGYVFKTSDVPSLKRSLELLCADDSVRTEVGKNAHQTMIHHNEDHSVKGVQGAIEFVLSVNG